MLAYLKWLSKRYANEDVAPSNEITVSDSNEHQPVRDEKPAQSDESESSTLNDS